MTLPTTKPRCHLCVETLSVAPCEGCGALLCPAHRWSTGNPQDGYYCVNAMCPPVDNRVPQSVPPETPAAAATPYLSSPAGLASNAAAVALLTAILVLAYLAKG